MISNYEGKKRRFTFIFDLVVSLIIFAAQYKLSINLYILFIFDATISGFPKRSKSYWTELRRAAIATKKKKHPILVIEFLK